MRIGIDAKSFFTGPVSTTIILQNLLPQLFRLFPQHEWVIFLDRKDINKNFPYRQNNIIIKYVWADNNMLSNIFLLPRLAHKLKVNVMVYQTFPAYTKKIPSIAFIHDVLFERFPEFFTWKEKLYFSSLKSLTKNARRLMVTSNFVARELITYGYAERPDKIDLVPLGVSKDFKPLSQHPPELQDQIKKKFNLPEEFILYVGRLNVRKNIEAILKAMPLLNDKNIALVIVGKEDWKTADLQKLSREAASSRRIIFTGELSNEEIVTIHAIAKIFIFPSFAEGFGLPPLEAMASGVPVIVSHTTALTEICADAATYIDPNQPSSIAKAVDHLLTDKAGYSEMKLRGIAHAEKFTWQNTAKAFMQSVNDAVQLQPDKTT
ncbi:MAG: glycosyltransferase family 4 protein [Flavisolibacter sp.]